MYYDESESYSSSRVASLTLLQQQSVHSDYRETTLRARVEQQEQEHTAHEEEMFSRWNEDQNVFCTTAASLSLSLCTLFFLFFSLGFWQHTVSFSQR
jgi:hypothetical protein